LGVKFGVLCGTGAHLWCYVYYPVDQVEAEHCMMPDGLKLSVPIPLDQGRIVYGKEAWKRLLAQDQTEFRPLELHVNRPPQRSN
jgi:hypothetical protein